jgi:DNA-binding NarL/FixJ family response regulator
MSRGPVAVCVVSNHPIVAAGVRALLSEHPDADRFSLVSEHVAADVVVYDAFNLARGHDRDDPAEDQAGELGEIIAEHPGRVLVLSRLLQPALTARALAAGAVAPVSIGADSDELIALVEATASGAIATDPELARENLEELTARLGADVGLTARERSVLALIAAGYSNRQIASELYLSINTVKSVIRSTYSRLGVHSRSQAVAWAIEHGYTASREATTIPAVRTAGATGQTGRPPSAAIGPS